MTKPRRPADAADTAVRAEPVAAGAAGSSEIGRRRTERRQANGRRSDERWAEILGGSAAVFARVGYSQATLEDIAREIGVNRASLYYYVGTKEELLVALLGNPLHMLRVRLEEVAARSLSAHDKLVEALRAYVRTMSELPELFIFMSENVHLIMSGPEADQIRSDADRYGKVLTGIVADGARAGEFRSDIDAQTLVLGIIGMFNWMHRWFDPKGPRTIEEIGNDFVTLATSALAPSRD
jgi:AcrR family transcriptional regulator